jgi:AcrR family transcriptional regulator
MERMRAARRARPAAPAPDVKRPRRSQVDRSAEARAILTDIAIEEIRQRGLAYVTMAEIAERAGMTRGAIQHHFGTRDNFMRSVLAALTERIAAQLALQPPVDRGAPDQLVRNCVKTLGELVLSSEQLAVSDITISSRSVPLLLADSVIAARRMVEVFSAAWRRWLDGAYAEDRIEKGFVIFSTFYSGVLVINYGQADIADLDEQLALCTELVTYALSG